MGVAVPRALNTNDYFEGSERGELKPDCKLCKQCLFGDFRFASAHFHTFIQGMHHSLEKVDVFSNNSILDNFLQILFKTIGFFQRCTRF